MVAQGGEIPPLHGKVDECGAEAMKDELGPPFLAWPKVGFSEWWHRQHNGLCRFCEDGEHKDCLDMSEEWNECDCATKGHQG